MNALIKLTVLFILLQNASCDENDNANENENKNDIEECVKQIQDRNYTAALNIFKTVPQDQVHFIVIGYTSHNETNFDPMFIFTHLVDDIDKKYLLYEALTDRVATLNDDCQVVKLIRLIYHELIACRDCPFNIIAHAHPLVINLTDHYKLIIEHELSVPKYKTSTDTLRIPDIFNVTIGDIQYYIFYNFQLSPNSGYRCIRHLSRISFDKHNYSRLFKLHKLF